MNCWEYTGCPKETYENCPAYPDRGLDCWKKTGVKCERGLIEKNSLEEKIRYCRTCDFYILYANKV